MSLQMAIAHWTCIEITGVILLAAGHVRAWRPTSLHDIYRVDTRAVCCTTQGGALDATH